MNCNLIYFGSPAFSAQILESIIVAHPPDCVAVGVVTQPDAKIPSPVAQLAAKYNLPTFKPEKLDDANLAHLKLLKPDLFLVVSYGQFFPQSWLETPKIGTYNLHFSLLPKYRGALPISEAIKNQDRETGVTLIKMDTKIDHGPLVAQKKVFIDINDNVATLTTKLTQAAIKLLSSLPPYERGGWVGVPQDDSLATFTPSFTSRTRENAFIPWTQISPILSPPYEGGEAQSAEGVQTAARLHALIRSLNPEPGAWTKIPVISHQQSETRQLEIKIIKTRLSADNCQLIPVIVQLPGKNPITWKQFLAGHQITSS